MRLHAVKGPAHYKSGNLKNADHVRKDCRTAGRDRHSLNTNDRSGGVEGHAGVDYVADQALRDVFSLLPP